MDNRLSSESGITLIELMMVVAIMAVVLAIGTYNFISDLPGYRIRGAANQLAAHMQSLKLRAVSTNRNAWFEADLANNFYTGFVDVGADGVADNPGDYNESHLDMPDDQDGVPGFHLPSTVSFGLPSDFSSGTGPDASAYPSDPVNTADNRIGFRSTGIPVIDLSSNVTPTNPCVIYLTNTKDQGYAVSVQITGRVKIFQWSGSDWL